MFHSIKKTFTTMHLQGFIKSIGEPRQWTTRNDEPRETYPVEIAVPYIDDRGTEREDSIIADLDTGNPDYMKKLEDAKNLKQRLDIRVGFSVREYNGKKFQNAKVWDVQIMM